MKSIFTILTLSIALFACKTTGSKSLSKGKYNKALNQALSTLQKDSKNERAKEVVLSAFPEVLNIFNNNIMDTLSRNEISKLYYLNDTYREMNSLISKINNSSNISSLLNSPKNYNTEIENIKYRLVEKLYQTALVTQQRAETENYPINKRIYYRNAYNDFAKAEKVMQGYNDISKKMEDCKREGTIHVIIQPANNYDNYEEYWTNRNEIENELVRVYNKKSVDKQNWITFALATFNNYPNNKKPDYVVRYRWQATEWGNYTDESRTENFSKDIKVGSGNNQTTQTITATANITDRTFRYSGKIFLELINAENYTTIRNSEEILSKYYIDSKATYTGDSRALSNRVENLTKKNRYERPNVYTIRIDFFNYLDSYNSVGYYNLTNNLK